MKQINNYIIEKLHLNRDTNINQTFDSPFKWLDYLRENGAKIYKDNVIYIICLEKGTKKVSGANYTYPLVEIELNIGDDKQWEGYWHEDGKLPIIGDDSDDSKYKILLDVKEFDRNSTKKPRGNYYTTKNANILLDALNDLYEKLK